MKVLDCHADLPPLLWHRGETLKDNTSQINLSKSKPFQNYAQFCAICSTWMRDAKLAPLDPAGQYEACVAHFLAQIDEFSEKVALCRDTAELDEAWRQGKVGFFLAMEGAEAISCDPGLLPRAVTQGVRMISLTWNHENALAGCHREGGGLTAQGREFVRRAQRLGIMLDVSHLSDAAFFDLCEIAEAPVIASHSNSRALCPTSRNLTDDMFREICRMGGFTGINLFPPFLSQTGKATLDDYLRHVDYLLSLSGGGHVAFGSDFDGSDALPEGIAHIGDYQRIAARLEAAGYDAKTMEEISHRTVLEVMKQCTTKAQEIKV